MSDELVTRYGLVLPMSAQWEYGCRASTTTVFWPGDEAADLAGNANVYDEAAARRAPQWGDHPEAFDDGHVMSAPVGSFGANAFGLYDVHGNVWEWCLDCPAHRSSDRNSRGGSFHSNANESGSGHQASNIPTYVFSHQGLRPARTLRVPD